ncbi:hypothetical protein [Spirillospora sp. CA-294931]|uniref:hypothetical protein n=1 Tax=Spirillospora sp. CA-294931 TaxID=3240042 RepID=UPI003D9195CE
MLLLATLAGIGQIIEQSEGVPYAMTLLHSDRPEDAPRAVPKPVRQEVSASRPAHWCAAMPWWREFCTALNAPLWTRPFQAGKAVRRPGGTAHDQSG